jgi:hypothetical protein
LVLPSIQVTVPSALTFSTMPTWLIRSKLSPGKSKNTTAPTCGLVVHRFCRWNQAAPKGV